MIAGLADITTGEIRIGGQLVNEIPPSKRDITMVFQNYALYPHMTVRKNLEIGLKLRGVSKPERQTKVREPLAFSASRSTLSAGRQSYPVVSANGWRWVAPLYATRRCSSSTSRSRTSTRSCALKSVPRSNCYRPGSTPRRSLSPTIRSRR